MNRRRFLVTLIALLCVSVAGAEEKTRNPFKVADVNDPDGQDVKDFANENKLAFDDKDPNAEQWAKEGSHGMKGSLEGTWDSRWNGGPGTDFTSGTAEVKVTKDRVYILYKDGGGTYLVDAKRNGKKLVGRYVNVNNADDSTPWVGQIIDDERIDGVWKSGRWDFRRKLPAKK